MSTQITLFDSHCHLDFPIFDGKLDAIVEKCGQVGIGGILIPGVNRDGWRRIRQITARLPICHTALGLHPMYIDSHQEQHLHDLEMALSVGPIAAIGEIGLDFYEGRKSEKKQLQFFQAQIDIAKTARLPVILHVRKAHDQVLQILNQSHFAFGGFVHAFNGSENQAERYTHLGFKLGFGGAMTYPRAAKIRKLASSLPIESIVLETDAPDMPPITCKQKHNTPFHLIDILKCMAELRGENVAQIARQTTRNVHSVLNLD
ncbi:TatD family hydrolase [Aliikangiella sp. G2MR2-5]|uniref:TatD family hydrolase n=1 Tax=Aliikangiella sp. G2MR2-5 TaxID=2788943 RepID=UPI0018AA3BF1|nr:TatD family hydrolase [Aliikangiella sp. G2MR2-5]